MFECYLVAEFSCEEMPPKLVNIGIYSEPWQTLTVSHSKDRFYANVLRTTGNTYHQAKDMIFATIHAYEGLHWVLEYIK